MLGYNFADDYFEQYTTKEYRYDDYEDEIDWDDGVDAWLVNGEYSPIISSSSDTEDISGEIYHFSQPAADGDIYLISVDISDDIYS